MPIMLDKLDINAQIQPKTFSPKFFDSKLTGVGKKTGVLNEMRNPMYVDPAEITRAENRTIRRRHYVSGSTDTTIIPISVLSTEAWDAMDLAPRPDDHKLVKIGSYKDVKGNTGELFVNMDVYSIVLQETRLAYQAGQKNGPSVSKKVTACYSVFLWMVFDKANLKHATTSIPGLSVFNGANTYCVDFTVNPKVYMDKVLHDLSRDPDMTMDPDAIKNFIDTYSLYDGVCRASEEWQTAIDKSLDQFFENAGHKRSTYGDNNIMNQTVYILRHIEDYNVPLDLYRQIYSDIMYRFSHDDAVMLCKENLNLLLSDTLNNLEQNKPALTCIPVQNPPVPVPNRAIPFSPEQQRAITSPDPLVLVQAGAGTGKSTVILGRIDWMIDSGIDPNDITVLSFTNAAANNITARNPTIHSMTIASMIHTIYAANFPEHELSTLDTIINSLEIYFGNLDVARKFRELCKAVIKNDPDGFTRMNNFVEQHYDEVMHMLDTIGQVSLELEIIICYQKIETLNEPSSVTSKYLIIDEVQDNSIFEFIYTLKYVDKHKESLFIVGDCSQTLYEFRASNPKALNVLEGSGVFTTYQLQVNYRSNQEILDFANVALQNIEANQYAHIQLRANSLQQVTEQSFTDKVHFKYHRLGKISDFDDRLNAIFANELKPYMDACLARGEQVALLAFTRKHVAQFMDKLKMLYPNASIASLVPEKMYNVTIFSMFVKNYWDEVQFIPAQSITDVITRCIMDRLQYLTHDPARAQAKVADMLDKWVQQYGADIAAWERQYLNSQMSMDDFLDNVKRSMLKFEISQNAIKQHLLALKNEETKNNQDAANANFVLSTIHSAKGLEFDNVVIIYRNDNDLAEDKKRMYYVAFTRAMRSEYIVAYDTVGSPNIEADYRTIVENLHKIAPRPTPTNTAIANARAILAAQKAGQTIQSIPGVPQMAAIGDDSDLALRPVSYSRDIMDASCISSPIDGSLPDAPVVLSKAFDPGAAIMAAQSIIAAVGEESVDADDETEDDTVFEVADKAAKD